MYQWGDGTSRTNTESVAEHRTEPQPLFPNSKTSQTRGSDDFWLRLRHFRGGPGLNGICVCAFVCACHGQRHKQALAWRKDLPFLRATLTPVILHDGKRQNKELTELSRQREKNPQIRAAYQLPISGTTSSPSSPNWNNTPHSSFDSTLSAHSKFGRNY